MDIEFVELQHREDITNLMEICGVSLEEAYHLYHQHNCSVQTAINYKLGIAQTPANSIRSQEVNSGELNVSFEEQEDLSFQKYKQFVEHGQSFLKKYPMRQCMTEHKKNNAKLEGEENNIRFLEALEKALGFHVGLKIAGGLVEDGFAWSWSEKFPIAILLLDFDQESKEILHSIFGAESMVDELNTIFRVYGINTKKDKLLSPFIDQYLNFAEDVNSLVVFRVNYVDDIQVVSKIKLTQYENFEKKVQAAKTQCIQKELEESHIVKQHALMRRGVIYHRPKSIREKIKMREDAKLRRQQDEDFFKACLPKQISKVAIQQLKPQKKSLSLQEIREIRELKRNNMKTYSQGMQLKIRIPSGNSYLLTVIGTQTVQYLFDYVECITEDIGFERDEHRCFEIVYGSDKASSLSGKRHELIQDVLEQFELLIVKETDE